MARCDPHLRVPLSVCTTDRKAADCRDFDAALVDTGATHTTIGKEAADRLSLRPAKTVQVSLGDGRRVSATITKARVCVGTGRGDEVVCREAPVAVLDGATQPVIGASTLAALDARIDVRSGRIRVRGETWRRGEGPAKPPGR